MSILGPTWRIQVYNGSGATSGAITVKGKRWKPNSSDGRADYEDTEQTFFNVASLANATYSSGSAISNDATTEGYYGVALSISITGSTATGEYRVYLQRSTNGGTTWPDNAGGDLVGVFEVTASTTEKFDVVMQ